MRESDCDKETSDCDVGMSVDKAAGGVAIAEEAAITCHSDQSTPESNSDVESASQSLTVIRHPKIEQRHI